MPKEKRSAEQIAPELGEVYWFWKDAEVEKEALRKEFFDAVTRSHAESDLATKTVVVDDRLIGADEPDDAVEKYVEQYNPGWTIVSAKDNRVIIREDPAFKHGEVVHIVDDGIWDRKQEWHPGYVVTKTIASGSLMVDTERMQEWEPDMYDALTVWQSFPDVDNDTDPALDDALLRMNWPRVIKADLDEDENEMIKPFVFEGPKQARLNVRYAKDDETPVT